MLVITQKTGDTSMKASLSLTQSLCLTRQLCNNNNIIITLITIIIITIITSSEGHYLSSAESLVRHSSSCFCDSEQTVHVVFKLNIHPRVS